MVGVQAAVAGARQRSGAVARPRQAGVQSLCTTTRPEGPVGRAMTNLLLELGGGYSPS